MRITVCGAGPAGLGMAACLMSCGHSVVIYDMPEYADRLVPFQKQAALVCRGKLEYSGQVCEATSDADRAISGADAVFIVTHAAAHKKLAASFAGKFRPGQLVVMCPGYVGGGVEFTQTLRRSKAEVVPPYMEASSLPIISSMEGPTTVRISGWKRNFLLYCPDALREHELVAWFQRLYAPVKIVESPLDPGLNEINFIVHAVVSLLNVGRVENGEDWSFYRTGLTPSIVRVIETIDQERVQLEEALNLVPHRLTDLLWEFYKDQGMSDQGLYTQLTTFEPFSKVRGPLDFEGRFISEDLCYGLVPMYWLGQEKGLPMEATRMMIQLAATFTGRDYFRNGRRISSDLEL